MAKNYLDYDGLLYFWQKLKTTFAKTGDVPTKTSQLANDSGYITSASIPSATTTTPKMDGTAAVGSETKWAKGDHVHPSDTSRVPTTRTVNGKALSEDITLKAEDIYINANENVETAIEERIKATDRTLGSDEGDFKYDFDVTIGDTIHSDHFYNTKWIDHNFARASTVLEGKVDKVEGKDLSTNDFTDALKTKLEGIAEGAEVNVNADWNATSGDAQILNKPTIPSAGTGTDFPKMDGTKALGTNAGYARVDHVHPSDTSRVPTTRTVNGKALSADVELKSDDIIYSENEGFNVTQELKKRMLANSVQQDGKLIGVDFYITNEDLSTEHKFTTIYTRDGVDYLMGLAQTALGNKVDKVTGKGLSTNDYTTEEKEKLAGITTGANTILNVVEVTDPVEGWYINGTYDKDGTISSISWYDANCIDGFFANATSQMGTALNGKVDKTSVGQASGVCPLDANSKVDAQYLPSYVDDVIEAYARSGQTALSQNWLATGSASGAVITPEAGVIYVLMADSGDYSANTQFRWGGTTYIKLNDGGVSAITNAEIDTIVAS